MTPTMAIEDKDFIMRQVKELAKSLGKMLSRNSLKELINLEVKDGELLSDEELDEILKEVDDGDEK